MAGLSSRALTSSPENRLHYNGKEEQRQEFTDGSGMDWLDYGARMYDAQVGRWRTLDPELEKFEAVTPYNYCFDNPVRYIDIKGKEPGDVVVVFAGGDIFSNQGLGETGSIVSGLKPYTDSKGGNVRNFVSPYMKIRSVGTPYGTYGALEDISLDNATEEAYRYILNNRSEDGKVIVYGYSWGGVLASHLAKRLEKDGINVHFMVTVDAANSVNSNSVERKVGDNVKENLNIFQKGVYPIGSKGDKNKRNDGSEKGIRNVIAVSYTDSKGKKHKVTHSNIDSATLSWVVNEILNKLSGAK